MAKRKQENVRIVRSDDLNYVEIQNQISWLKTKTFKGE